MELHRSKIWILFSVYITKSQRTKFHDLLLYRHTGISLNTSLKTVEKKKKIFHCITSSMERWPNVNRCFLNLFFFTIHIPRGHFQQGFRQTERIKAVGPDNFHLSDLVVLISCKKFFLFYKIQKMDYKCYCYI